MWRCSNYQGATSVMASLYHRAPSGVTVFNVNFSTTKSLASRFRWLLFQRQNLFVDVVSPNQKTRGSGSQKKCLEASSPKTLFAAGIFHPCRRSNMWGAWATQTACGGITTERNVGLPRLASDEVSSDGSLGAGGERLGKMIQEASAASRVARPGRPAADQRGEVVVAGGHEVTLAMRKRNKTL